MTADARLDLLPIEPPAPGSGRPPIALVRRHGDLLYASGQTAVDSDGSLVATGVVGSDVDLTVARVCAWQCAGNVLRAVRDELGTLASITAVVRLTVYVASTADFVGQHLVADAATALFREVLGDGVGHHARAAIGVAALPTGSPVEVDAILASS